MVNAPSALPVNSFIKAIATIKYEAVKITYQIKYASHVNQDTYSTKEPASGKQYFTS